VNQWSLVYYETANGRCPVKEYLDGLGAKETERVVFDLELLREFGLDLGVPYVKNIHGKLWELRTTGRSRHRVLYFAASGKRFVLLHAFTKKTGKTPPAEIKTADNRMNEYLNRG